MTFWTTGRIDVAITFESFQPTLLKISNDVNSLISQQDYGNLISSFDMIVNIFKEPSTEKFWYSTKSKETNIDVNIDHDEFLNVDDNLKYKLYVKAILFSVDKLRHNKNLKDFNFELFYNSIASLL